MTLKYFRQLRFNFSVWVVLLLVVIIGFDFLFGLELGEVIESFSPDHGFFGVELELVIGGDGVKELLSFIDSEFFDFVAVEEE